MKNNLTHFIPNLKPQLQKLKVPQYAKFLLTEVSYEFFLCTDTSIALSKKMIGHKLNLSALNETSQTIFMSRAIFRRFKGNDDIINQLNSH